MTQIGLEGMEFYAYHGFYPTERKTGHKYIVDVFVTLRNDLDASENIAHTFNYEDIFKICKMEMDQPRRLLETVTYNIAARLKKEQTNIEKIDIKLRKVGVQLGGEVKQSVIKYSI